MKLGQLYLKLANDISDTKETKLPKWDDTTKLDHKDVQDSSGLKDNHYKIKPAVRSLDGATSECITRSWDMKPQGGISTTNYSLISKP
jgi:hypothetical protein